MDYYSRNRSIGYQKPKTSYRNNYSNWNWGTYSGFSTLKEEDDDLFIAKHDSYFTPGSHEIEY